MGAMMDPNCIDTTTTLGALAAMSIGAYRVALVVLNALSGRYRWARRASKILSGKRAPKREPE